MSRRETTRVTGDTEVGIVRMYRDVTAAQGYNAEYRRVKESVKAVKAAWRSLNCSIFAMLRLTQFNRHP